MKDILPLGRELFLDLDDLLVCMPHALTGVLLQQSISNATDFYARQDARDFTLINLGLVASDLVELILESLVLLYRLGQLGLVSLERFLHRVVHLGQRLLLRFGRGKLGLQPACLFSQLLVLIGH